MTGGNLRNLLAQVDDWSRLPSAWETSLRAGIRYDEETQRTLARLIALAPEAVQLLADMAEAIRVNIDHRAAECGGECVTSRATLLEAFAPLLARFGRLDQQAGQ